MDVWMFVWGIAAGYDRKQPLELEAEKLFDSRT